MKRNGNPKLLMDVARLYYEAEETKSNIAKILDTSVTQVNRWLKEARERGFVEVRYSPPRLYELGKRLTTEFPCLRRAIVVPSSQDYPFQRRLWGEAAAEYFEEHVTRGMKVGISGGYTVYEMVKSLPYRDRDIEIYPTAIIGRGDIISHLDPMILVPLLWAKSGSNENKARYVTILPIKDGMSVTDLRKSNNRLLKEHGKVRKVYDEMRHIDFFFGSIGSVEVLSEYRQYTHHTTIQLLNEVGITERDLRNQQIVGDINYSFFDKDGNKKPDEDFFLTLDVDYLREMAKNPQKHVVIMAGVYKDAPLKAALKGQLFNVLITDARTARMLLNDPTPEINISE